MKPYHDLLRRLLDEGKERGDRTGVGTLGLFGAQMRFDLAEGFPLLTTKKVHFKSVLHELLWFISGSTNIQSLVKAGVGIWTDWPLKKFNEYHQGTGGIGLWDQKSFERSIRNDDEFARRWGDLGPVYGAQWRRWNGGMEYRHGSHQRQTVDQLAWVIKEIKRNPTSRRLLVNAWHPIESHMAALPPCHYAFQFHVEDGRLNCMFHMRSVDTFLGLPFNIASYALLTHMVAQVCGLEPGELVWTGGDVHLYLNHIEQARTLLAREPFALPELWLNPAIDNIDDFTADDIRIEHYSHHPKISAPVAV